MAALSVSASSLKCSVAVKNINMRSIPIKIGQMRKPSLQLQRRSFKLHVVAEEKESDEECNIGMSLSEGIDREILRQYRADEYADKASAKYNSAIETLSLGGFTDDALELKQCMEMKRIPLNTSTFCPIIIGLCLQEKKVGAALDLLEESKRKPGCKPNEYAYGAIIERMYLEKKDTKAIKLVREMISDGLVPLEVTVAGFIKSLLHNKLFATATELVHEILPPNIAYYKCLIEALERIDEAILAKNTLGLMQQRGVDPDYECYCSVATSCASKGLFDDATRVVRKMRSKGFPEVKERMEERKGKRTNSKSENPKSSKASLERLFDILKGSNSKSENPKSPKASLERLLAILKESSSKSENPISREELLALKKLNSNENPISREELLAILKESKRSRENEGKKA